MSARPPILLPAAEYAPDMPDYDDQHSSLVMNVIPRTPTSYGPLPTPAGFSGALAKRCQGAIFGLDSSGNVNGFAGDQSDLYQLTAGSANAGFTAVSKALGGYHLASDEQWKFALFGTRLVATNLGDPMQSWLLGTSTAFADLSSAAPKARHIATVKSFLFAANTSDPAYGNQPQRVWWSGNGDPTNWPTPGTAAAAQFQSDFQDLLGDGGWIQGLVGNLATADAAIFMEHAVWRAVYSGGAATFGFFPAQGVRGTPAPGSIAQLGSNVYFLGEDGFYAFDGTTAQPIGANKIDKTFYQDLDQTYMGSISSAIDPLNKLYIVFYPGSGHTGSLCNKMMIFNWVLNRWSIGIPLPPGGGEIIVRALSFGYTLDELYTVLGYTIDGLPFNLDSRVWSGGNLLLGVFDSLHKLNFFTGTPLAATIDSSEVQPFDGQLMRVLNTRPIVEGGATPIISLGTRNRTQDAVVYSGSVTLDALGNAPIRGLARYIRSEVTIPTASSWTHFSGVELDGVPAGVR